MLSHATPATIAANNREADRIMAQHAAKPYSHIKGHGVDRDAPKGSKSEALADALARRNRG